MVSDPMSIEEFRSHLSERIPANGTEDDTRFLDTELQEILDRCSDNFYMALAEGWSDKAGRLAELIDINENGSDRKLSQKFKAAIQQAKRYDALAEKWAAETNTTYRPSAVARGFDAWASECAPQISIFPGDGSIDDVRQYPLKRFFPAVHNR